MAMIDGEPVPVEAELILEFAEIEVLLLYLDTSAKARPALGSIFARAEAKILAARRECQLQINELHSDLGHKPDKAAMAWPVAHEASPDPGELLSGQDEPETEAEILAQARLFDFAGLVDDP
jgi:hypothetical protein